MKPFIALAASAPFMLLAGVGHAGTFTFSDPNCSSFTMSATGVVTCASTTPTDPVDPVPTDPVDPAPTDPVDPAPTDPVDPAPVVGGACPSSYVVPAGTSIIWMGSKDEYSTYEFNQAFDAPGNRIDSKSGKGQIKAWEFTNDAYQYGKLNGTQGILGGNYKDWSISACPGDFSSTLPFKCQKIGQLDVTLAYHATDATKGCVVPKGQKMYLNVRASDPAQEAGYVMSNAPSVLLP